jgi:hypothetical protein
LLQQCHYYQDCIKQDFLFSHSIIEATAFVTVAAFATAGSVGNVGFSAKYGGGQHF